MCIASYNSETRPSVLLLCGMHTWPWTCTVTNACDLCAHNYVIRWLCTHMPCAVACTYLLYSSY